MPLHIECEVRLELPRPRLRIPLQQFSDLALIR
jgi:hypothetical protein